MGRGSMSPGSGLVLNEDDEVVDLINKIVGGIKVSLADLLAGEDQGNGVFKVIKRGNYAYISTATTTTIKTSAGHINNIRVLGGTMGNVTIYDNTAGSGTVMVPAVTPAAGQVLLEDVDFSTGLTIVTAAATILVISFI